MIAMRRCDVCDQETVAELVERAMARSAALLSDADRLRQSSRTIRRDVQRARAMRERRRGQHGVRRDAGFGFRLRGFIETAPVAAQWTPGGLVDASDELLVRADLVVRLGETFTFADGSREPASLEAGATRALLTLMRACDRVESVSLELADSPPP